VILTVFCLKEKDTCYESRVVQYLYMKHLSNIDFQICTVTVGTPETSPISAAVFEPTVTAAAATKACNITSICGN
jgi:hypothetical protein